MNKNPLDEQLDIYKTVKDALKVTRRTLDERKNPLEKTDFYGLTRQEGDDKLKQAEELLDKLVAFALFTAFERYLRDYLANTLAPLKSIPTIPDELAENLYGYLQDNVDYWKMNKVIELFSSPTRKNEVDNAKAMIDFRNKVAHGALSPNAIPPDSVHRQLTALLENAGLICDHNGMNK